jgi:exodeoxyribonuclease VII large subunit
LKACLEAEGLFDVERKRPLPSWPKRIGLVTSPTGAALRDVVHVLERRFPLVEVILAPTPVQGEDAIPGITEALEALNRFAQPDVILLVRGGGSIEDLWAFNSEQVARAIAASSIPVVTGIGHETDVLIADFVADVRAPTPSAAAEVSTPDRLRLADDLSGLRLALVQGLRDRIWEDHRRLNEQRAHLRLVSPRARVASAKQRVDELLHRANAATRHSLDLRRAAIEGVVQTLYAVGPSSVLARGYAIVTRVDDGDVVRSVGQVTSGDLMDVRVSDGSFGAQVTSSQGKTDPESDR